MEDHNKAELALDVTNQLGVLVQEFEQKIKNGTRSTENFITMDELDKMLSGLVGDASEVFRDFVGKILSEVDESEVIRKKNRARPIRDWTPQPRKARPDNLNRNRNNYV